MSLPLVAVAFEPDPEVKEALIASLQTHAEVCFLPGLDEAARAAAFDRARAVIVRVLNRDLVAGATSRTGDKLVQRDVGGGELSRAGGKLIQTMIAGVDMIPFDQVPDDVLVAHNGGAFGLQMAEHIVGMILAARKDLFARHTALQRGEWIQWSPATRELLGSTALIVGFGGIGKATTNLLRAFGVSIMALNRSGKTDEPVDFVGTLNDLNDVLPRADIVVLCAGLNAETRGLIDAGRLSRMKDDAVLVNVARGPVIVEADLYAHLVAHPSFWACLDTWWGEPFAERRFTANFPFIELPNVLGSPHNSAVTGNYMRRAAGHAAANVVRYLQTGQADRLVTAADMP